jgi:PH (Pleckstrin Homology) domain-containing protein/putative oligomerization/nucleic acid binding protein
MARYADGLIAEGEHILLRTRQHWFSIVAYTVAFWILVAVAVGFFLLGRVTNWDFFNWIALIGFVGALVWIGWRYASWTFQDYIVTNRRVMQVEGIVNKVSRDSSLEKINDAVLRQGLFGRLLHFGDLEVLTASEQTVDQFKMLNEAAEFKKTMLNAKYALEREYAAPMPSPPLRVASTPADAPTAAAEPIVPAAVASAPAAPPVVPPVAMSSEEVTDTLHRLADLRDRGAISAAEYEAKKAELLGRI